MLRTVLYVIAGYISGSVLYARVFCSLLGKEDILQRSPDQNPGTTNAFVYGGFWCGLLTLLFDLLKGFVPVFFYLLGAPVRGKWQLSAVLSAPVIGHIFPAHSRFKGGKGIATTFGCLLGLYPYGLPVLLFAAAFIFLSVGLRISPHFYRIIWAYLGAFAAMTVCKVDPAVYLGFGIITAAVCLRMYLSKEEKEQFEVKLLWMR